MKSSVSIRRNLFIVLAAFSLSCEGQTAIANRIAAAIDHLPAGAHVAAKFTSNSRHCFYYTYANRLYRYDAIMDNRSEVVFANEPYQSIMDTYLEGDKRYLLVAVNRRGLTSNFLMDGEALWCYDLKKRKFSKSGEGFNIQKRKDCFIISRASRCLNPNDPPQQQRWMVRDHYYELNGKVDYYKDEYLYRSHAEKAKAEKLKAAKEKQAQALKAKQEKKVKKSSKRSSKKSVRKRRHRSHSRRHRSHRS